VTDSTQDGPSRVVIRDRRRIDPQTGAPRQVATKRVGVEETVSTASSTPAAATETATDELAALRTQLAERTADLKRVTAEYANYRKRVDRDRTLAAEQATAIVLTSLLPVLDDLDRARAHGDLTGAFGAVAEQLVNTLAKLGLQPFGETGDAFDPTWHEAVAHTTSSEVGEPTCVEVLRRGYSFGDRLLRPAMVTVAAPGDDQAAGGPDPEPTTGAGTASDPGATSAGAADDRGEPRGELAGGAPDRPAADHQDRPRSSGGDGQAADADVAEVSGEASHHG